MNLKNNITTLSTHSYIDFECDGGVLSLNNARQETKLTYLDLQMGKGTFAMNVAHVYSNLSHLDNTGMGSNWKLNIQQYVKKYDGSIYLDGFTTNDYVFVDESGQLHRFSLIENTSNRYLDQNASGLILTVEYNGYEIRDKSQNVLVFDSYGRLTQMKAMGRTKEIIKQIEYNATGFPTSFYDTRSVGVNQRVITFEYKNNLLSKMALISKGEEKESIFYTYEGSNLKGAYYFINNALSHASMYKYDASGLNLATGSTAGQAVSIVKSGNSIDINEGISKIKLNNLEVRVGATGKKNLFIGDELIGLGEDQYIADYFSQEKSLIENYSCLNLSSIFSQTKVTYQETYTDVTTNSNVKYRYYFNKDGNVISNFEIKGNDLLTLSRDKGYCLQLNENVSYVGNTLNRKDILFKYVGDSVSYSNLNIESSSESVRSFRRYCKNIVYSNYVCSFWINHKLNNASYVNAQINVFNGNSTITEECRIDEKAYNGWQYVEIPFSFSSNDVSKGYRVSSLSIKILSDLAGNYEVSNIRLDSASRNKMAYTNTNPVIEFSGVSSVYLELNNQNGRTINFGTYDYITPSDIISSLRNKALSNSGFDFVYNGGTKRISGVSSMQFILKNSVNYPVLINDLIELDFYTYSDIGEKTITQVTIENNQIITRKIAGNSVQEKTVDLQGRELISVDSYDKKTVNKYDEYGNIVITYFAKKSAFDLNNNIISSNKYYFVHYFYTDNTNEGKFREEPYYKRTPDSSISYVFNENQLNQVKTINTVLESRDFSYDDINRVVSISSAGKENHIAYDEQGKLKGYFDNDKYRYTFDYDIQGNLSTTSIEVNNQKSKLYEEVLEYKNNIVNSHNYLTGSAKRTYMDEYGRISGIQFQEENENGEINFTFQEQNAKITTEAYPNHCDQSLGLSEIKVFSDGYCGMQTEFTYDCNNISKGYSITKGAMHYLTTTKEDSLTTKYKVGSLEHKTQKVYNDNLLNPKIATYKNCEVSEQSGESEKTVDLSKYCYNYEYHDILGVVSKRFSGNSNVEFSFEDGSFYSKLVQSKKQIFGGKKFDFYYSYNKERISNVSMDTSFENSQISYSYDGLNRLINEFNTASNTGYNYVYNDMNRLSTVLKNGQNHKSFVYDSLGRLTRYVKDNQTIATYTYNGNLLNPTNITKNGINNICVWQNEGDLITYGDISFQYNAFGIRTKKQQGSNEIVYYYAGDKLLGEDRNNDRVNIRYMYDQQEIVGARYHTANGNTIDYEYVKDAYGNVIAVVNGSNVVVKYRYDAWGNCTEIGKNPNDPFANINPIRYRSYYLDLETGYYYLHNRYYDPEIGAFISPDSTEYLDPESIGGLNLYAYCLNNPVMYFDPNGNLALSTVIILGLIGIGAVVGVGTVVYLDYQDDGQIFNGSIGWETYLAAGLLGGIIGGVLGYYAGPTIASLLANPGNISLASLVFAGGGSTGGLTISIAAVGQIALAGAVSTTAIGTIGATYMFAKNAKSGGYRVKSYYPNDHLPPHVHVFGDDIKSSHGIRVGLDGKPLKGEPPLSPRARKAVKRLMDVIKEMLKPWKG